MLIAYVILEKIIGGVHLLKNINVQFKATEEMVEKIDGYARRMGLSRSSFIMMAIGEKLMNLDTTYKVLEDVAQRMSENAKND